MLKITIPEQELFDNANQKFVTIDAVTFQIEHSLISLSKWESEWHVAFLDKKRKKTPAEIIDYIRCMTVTQNVKPETYLFITDAILKDVLDYVDNPMSATKVSEHNLGSPSTEPVTSEMLYAQMIMYGVPVEFEKWHLNRLMTLLKVLKKMNTPTKKMSKSEIFSRNRELNAWRKAHWGTAG